MNPTPVFNSSLFLSGGTSLWPLVKQRVIVVCDAIDREKVQFGDIIAFIENEKMIAHRVMFKRSENNLQWYFLGGHPWSSPDGWIPEYRILGKVVRSGRVDFLKPKFKILNKVLAFITLLFLGVRGELN